MAKGIIKRFDFRKGFGFIVDDESGEDFFFHKSGWNGNGPIRLGMAVEFVSKESEKGPQADSVTPIGGDNTSKKKPDTKLNAPASLEDRINNLESSVTTWKVLTLVSLVGVIVLGIATFL